MPPERLLIVEDDPAVRSLLVKALASALGGAAGVLVGTRLPRRPEQTLPAMHFTISAGLLVFAGFIGLIGVVVPALGPQQGAAVVRKIERLAQLVVPGIADFCTVNLVRPDGGVSGF